MRWLFYQIFRVASRTSACLLHPCYNEYAFTLIFLVNHFVPFAIVSDTSPYYDKVHFATWSSLFVFACILSFSDAGLASVPWQLWHTHTYYICHSVAWHLFVWVATWWLVCQCTLSFPCFPIRLIQLLCLLYPRFVLCGIQPKQYFRHCVQAASLPTTFVPLFCPVFFWIEPFQSHLFLPCEFSVMLRRNCPSCVAAVAVTNKIVRNLPFSSLPPITKRVLRTIFMVLSHMVPHPCFWLHVKIKFHF